MKTKFQPGDRIWFEGRRYVVLRVKRWDVDHDGRGRAHYTLKLDRANGAEQERRIRSVDERALKAS